MTRKIAALAASLALLASPAAAAASGNPQDAQDQVPNPWVMLTALSASQSGTDIGQATEPPPPPPPGYRAASDDLLGPAPVLPVVVWIGLVALILSSTHHHQFMRPNSPA